MPRCWSSRVTPRRWPMLSTPNSSGSMDGPASEARRRNRGFEVAAAHSWERSADRHLEAYRHASDHPRGPSVDR